MKQRKYILQMRSTASGFVVPMNYLKPMTHKQACTMKDKFTVYACRTIELLEVQDDYQPVKYTSN